MLTTPLRSGAFLATLLLSGYVCAGENVQTLIRRQSQEFSDASAAGDRTVLDKYLDDQVVFMDETGDISSKKQILESAQPHGFSQTLVQENFAVQLYDSVAVTSFTDLSTTEVSGQTLKTRYRSTEVWRKHAGKWLMISSQTMTLQEDPPAVALPAKLLDQYVGKYQAGPNFTFTIGREGGELTGSVNGGKPLVMKAELADVLFTPGQPTLRRIMQRNEHGDITGFIARRDGHDLVLKRVG